jgi:hypothetical protein
MSIAPSQEPVLPQELWDDFGLKVPTVALLIQDTSLVAQPLPRCAEDDPEYSSFSYLVYIWLEEYVWTIDDIAQDIGLSRSHVGALLKASHHGRRYKRVKRPGDFQPRRIYTRAAHAYVLQTTTPLFWRTAFAIGIAIGRDIKWVSARIDRSQGISRPGAKGQPSVLHYPPPEVERLRRLSLQSSRRNRLKRPA